MIPEDKSENQAAAGCFGLIMALVMLFGMMMFLGTGGR